MDKLDDTETPVIFVPEGRFAAVKAIESTSRDDVERLILTPQGEVKGGTFKLEDTVYWWQFHPR